MVGYFRDEVVVACDAGQRLLSVALNRSSCPDPTPFYQQVIDTSDDSVRSLEPALQVRWLLGVCGAAQSPRAALLGRRFGGGTTAVVADVERQERVGEVTVDQTSLRAALDAQGEELALVLPDRIVFFELPSGVKCGELAMEAGAFGHVAATELGWVVARRKGRGWLAQLIAMEGPIDESSVRAEYKLAAEPYQLVAALSAPVVACGVGSARVQVIDLAAEATFKAKAHSPADRYSAVGLSIASDGQSVLSRGTHEGDLSLWQRKSPKTAAPCGELPLHTKPFGQPGDELLTIPAFQLLSAHEVLTVCDGQLSRRAL